MSEEEEAPWDETDHRDEDDHQAEGDEGAADAITDPCIAESYLISQDLGRAAKGFMTKTKPEFTGE